MFFVNAAARPLRSEWATHSCVAGCGRGVSPMIQCPQFKAHLRAEPLPGEGLLLLSERGQTALRGRLYELVAPLIDGRRSADVIVEQLDSQLSAAEVYYALRHLEKKGYLAESNGLAAGGQKAFWQVQNIDPTAAAQRLHQTTVSLTGLGGMDGEPLAT